MLYLLYLTRTLGVKYCSYIHLIRHLVTHHAKLCKTLETYSPAHTMGLPAVRESCQAWPVSHGRPRVLEYCPDAPALGLAQWPLGPTAVVCMQGRRNPGGSWVE